MTFCLQNNSSPLIPIFSNTSPVLYSICPSLLRQSISFLVVLVFWILPFLLALRVWIFFSHPFIPHANHLNLLDFMNFTIFLFSKICSFSLMLRILHLPSSFNAPYMFLFFFQISLTCLNLLLSMPMSKYMVI